MRYVTLASMLAVTSIALSAGAAQEPATGRVTVTKAPGGSVRTTLGHGLTVNEHSSLQREWIAIHDASMPADVVETPGIVTAYKSGDRYSSGQYEYTSAFTIDAREPLAALEVHFLTFDVWGDLQRTLSFTDVRDLAIGRAQLRGTWALFSENECSEHFASIAYVARVRTAAGRVVVMNPAPVLEEARRFSAKLTIEDLEKKDE